MSRRPLGATLLAVALGVMGLAALALGLSWLGEVAGSTIDPSAPPAVRSFLVWFPVALLAWGVLDLAAAGGLWATAPWGRTAALLALGAWLLEELAALVAVLAGWPSGVDLGLSPLGPVLRLGAVGLAFGYVWRRPAATASSGDGVTTVE